MDEAVKVFGLAGKVRSGCVTERVRLVGSDAWARNMFIGLIQRVSWAFCELFLKSSIWIARPPFSVFLFSPLPLFSPVKSI